MSVEVELIRRLALWHQIQSVQPDRLNAQFIRDLKLYGGYQGIWADAEATRKVSPGTPAVTVSILHTGAHYPDDISEDGIIYHYPETKRPLGRDRSEIEATKAAHEFVLPLFVILSHPTKAEMRVVKLAWVIDWDDQSKQFLILFGEEPWKPKEIQGRDSPFQLQSPKVRRTAKVQVRAGQQKFRFDVLKSYGPKCSVCSLAIPELLAAAHICGKEHNGSDDWRNGIPLCHSHHAAFDAHLFFIDPQSLAINVADGLSHHQLAITETTLSPLHSRPHSDALNWRMDNMIRRAPRSRTG